MIQSFNSLVLRWMKKHRNEIPRGQLSENLTRKPDTTHYALRFCVKYLLSNCMCRPDFISYTGGRTRKNPGLWLKKRVLFKCRRQRHGHCTEKKMLRRQEEVLICIFLRCIVKEETDVDNVIKKEKKC